MKDAMFKKCVAAKWKRVLCIDPGIRHLGYAFWPEIRRGPKRHTVAPKDTGLLTTPKGVQWEDAVYECMASWLVEYITVHHVRIVVIEGVEFWADSTRSQVAAKKGDLLRLTFLVGALGQVVYALCDKKAVIVEPTLWKGDMPKPVMKARVRRALHRKYREHEYDGVAMGLRIMGKL
jgi:Holliday junction resolvasome RuvABC endonuclease subunit